MNTRLEILVDGVWESLGLFNKSSIKYNKILNKIATINNREISHSNTLDIPLNYNNRSILGMNVFNKEQLVKALNSRYEAKYYIEDKLVQEGFVVINKSDEDQIKVNFIDSSLEIIDFWGSLNFRQLLNDPSLSIPLDYQDSINELKTYILDRNDIAPITTSVGVRGYNLCLFPNNLNVLGDNYMRDDDDKRPDNSISPYQSRPIFNAKSIFDLACEAFGYTSVFDESVDWEDISETFVVSSGLSDNFVDEGITTVLSTLTYDNDSLLVDSTLDTIAILSPSSRSVQPINLLGWVDPEVGWIGNHLDKNVIFKPDIEIQANGVVRYNINFTNGGDTNPNKTWGVWKNTTSDGVVFKELIVENIVEEGGNLKYDINKIQLFDKPVGAGDFVGILSTIETDEIIFNYQITETFLPIESVNYDEMGQFSSELIDLTFAAPSDNVKALLVGLMDVFGILMNIDSKNKEVTFFNYARFVRKKKELEFTDLSEYLLEYEPFGYNTDFGNSFGKLNEVGLNTPFKGNTFFVQIENEGGDSKLKDFATNVSKTFKDVTQVNRINNSQTPYNEYTNKGLGLVRNTGVLNDLDQIRFLVDPQTPTTYTTQGTIVGVPIVENYRLAFLPSGISEWYRLVEKSVKAKPKFLLPIDVIRNLDLSIPVYIEQLGGYYIIEEISEYVNPQTKVTIEVIKLIDGAEFSDDFSEDFNI